MSKRCQPPIPDRPFDQFLEGAIVVLRDYSTFDWRDWFRIEANERSRHKSKENM